MVKRVVYFCIVGYDKMWSGAGWQELRKRRLTKSLDSDENFKPYLVKLGKTR